MTKFKRLFSGLILSVGLIIPTACNFRNNKMDLAAGANLPWFQRIQTTVIAPRCQKCHTQSNQLGGHSFDTYADLMKTGTVVPGKPDASSFFTAIDNGRMPKFEGRISQQQIDLVRQWISEGAPEVFAPTKVDPDEPRPEFSYVYPKIFKPKCTGCHRPGSKKTSFDMTTYEAIMDSGFVVAGDVDNSDLYWKIEFEQMPPDELPKLSTEERKLIFDWIKNGATKDGGKKQ